MLEKACADIVEPTFRDMSPTNLEVRTGLASSCGDLNTIANADVAQAGP